MPTPAERARDEITVASTVSHEDKEPFSGPWVTKRHGGRIDHMDIDGPIILDKHNDVVAEHTSAHGVWENQERRGSLGFQAHYCDLSSPVGVDDTASYPPWARDYGAACCRIGDYLFDHVLLGGFIDLIHPEHGEMIHYHVLFGPPCADPLSRHQGNKSAHCDPFQPRPSFAGWSSALFQHVKFLNWPIKPGESLWSRVGDLSLKPSTAGMANLAFSGCRKTVLKGWYLEGNFSQIAYNQKITNSRGAPTGTAIMDGMVKRVGGRTHYGKVTAWNFHQTTVEYGRVVDADTGAPIPGHLYLDRGGSNGTLRPAGPWESYPTYTPASAPPPRPLPPVPSEGEVRMTPEQWEALKARMRVRAGERYADSDTLEAFLVE